jgi:hypothetical protein
MTANLTTLPPGPASLEDRSSWAYVLLDSLHDTIPDEQDPKQIVQKAVQQAKDLHRRIYVAQLDTRLEMEFIGSVMAADAEARLALEDPTLDSCQAVFLRQLVAACWAAALNWRVPTQYQR